MRINRTEVLLENWKALEKSLVGFGEANASTRRELLAQQYGFLRAGVWRLSLDPQPQEKANLQLLKGSLARMEKQLWPNLLVRGMVKLKAELFDRPRFVKEFKEMKELNERELEKFLQQKGFSALAAKLGTELDYERPWFAMRMSGQLDGGSRLELELQIVKMHDGRYYPSLIDATLTDIDGSKVNHEFLLSDYMLDAPLVTSLMQGRAVAVMDRDSRGGESEVWLQVHLDPKENYLRRFPADYGFDAGKLLTELAVMMGKVELDDERILAELKKGNQVSFIAGAPFNRTFLLEADPSSKQLILRSELGQELSLAGLCEQRAIYLKQIEKGMESGIEVKAQRQAGQVQQNGLGV